jgi:putative FmdB family regulatory protein
MRAFFMPTYEYECSECGVFDARRTIAERDAPASCPACAAGAARVMRSAPLLSSLAGASRVAHGINERAANEPTRSSTHGSSCGCCSGKVRLPRSAEPQAASRTAGGRPWMISH